MLSKDYKEFIELLNKNRAKYLVVGGYAVAIHGYPRFGDPIAKPSAMPPQAGGAYHKDENPRVRFNEL